LQDAPFSITLSTSRTSSTQYGEKYFQILKIFPSQHEWPCLCADQNHLAYSHPKRSNRVASIVPTVTTISLPSKESLRLHLSQHTTFLPSPSLLSHTSNLGSPSTGVKP